jgi:SAM-dependent methyltransferase
MTTTSSDHVAANRAAWDEWAANYAEGGARNWAAPEPSWGIFDVPEAQLGLLPPDLAGQDAVELGCGTAYVSAWLARRGANVVGIDNSPKQLESARRLQAEHGLSFPLHLGDAERTPFADASFDFAISEYGASIWCDPERWIPEAARILRPGGELVFLVNGLLMMLCTPDDPARIDDPVSDRLERPLFGVKRFAWPDGSVEFHLSHGDWIRLLRRHGFDVEDLIEIRPAADASTRYPFVTLDWARRWPCEEVWKARKR